MHFQVALDVVALLRRDKGATFALGEDKNKELSYSSGVWFETQNKGTYCISACFI